MAENIEIVVQDKVDSSVSKKLKDIASAANEAHSSIYILKRAMKGISFNAVSKIQSEVKKVSSLEYNQMSKTYDVWRKKMDAYYSSAQAKLEKGRISSVNKELGAQANIKQGGYQSQINVENNRNKLKDGSYAAQINAENTALQSQSKIKQGLYQQEINLQNKRANLNQGSLQSQINAENEAIKGQTSILAGNYAAQMRVESAREKLKSGNYVAQIKQENSILESQQRILEGRSKLAIGNQVASDNTNIAKINAESAALKEKELIISQTAKVEEKLFAARAKLNSGNIISQINAENAALKSQQASLVENALAEKNLTDAKDKLLNRINPLRSALQGYKTQVLEANNLLRQGVINANQYGDAVEYAKSKLERTRMAQTQWNESLLKTNNTSKLSRMHLVNLGYQLNDVGVSLASGQNPLTVFIQQGSQVAGIAAAAGVSMGAMAKAAFLLVLPFLPLAAAIGAVVGALALFRSELNKGEPMKEFAKTLGLTASEMKRLKDVTVTTGDTFKGFFKVLEDRFGTTTIFKKFADGFIFVFKQVLEFTKGVFIMIYALGKATYDSSLAVWNNFPALFGDLFINAANVAVLALEGIANFGVDAVNRLGKAVNESNMALGGEAIFGEIEKVALPKFENKFKGSISAIGSTFSNSLIESVKTGEKETDRFMKDLKKASTEVAKDRIRKQASDILEGKSSSDKSAEKRALSLAKINAELDNELNRMFMLRPEREMQARYDQIEEKLIGKKIKLTQQESEAIKAKIKTIREATLAQAKYDQLYDEIKGPLENYNALIMAGDELFKRRVISQEKFEAIFANAAEQYKQASDPLYTYNKTIEDQTKLLGYNSKEREIQSKLMEAENDLRSKNVPNLEQELLLLKEKYKTLQQLTSIQTAYDAIYDSTKGKQEDLKNALEANNRAYRDGLLSADQYSISLNSLGNEAIELKMKMGDVSWSEVETSAMYQMVANFKGGIVELRDTFGNFFTGITDGFANAFGRAAIYGEDFKNSIYELSRTVLSQLISSLVKVGIQLAINAALGNSMTAALGATSAIPGGGFLSMLGFAGGGYTGSGPTNQIAGPVHRKEFVFDAAATQRLGVGTLEALRSGAAGVAQNGSSVGKGSQSAASTSGSGNSASQQPVNVNVPFTAIVVDSKESAMAAIRSNENRTFIIETLQKNKQTVAKIAGVK